MTRHLGLALLFLLLLAAPAAAQTTTTTLPTEFRFLLLPATGDPATLAPLSTQTTGIGATQNCGIDPATLPPPATGTPINPTLFTLDDPFTPNRKCRLSFPQALTAGNYQWAGEFVAPSCNPTGAQVVSPCPSPRSVGQPPFSVANRTNRPVAPIGLQILSTP